MIALITAVFMASLLGSMHCAGMCGAFLAFAVGAGDDRGTADRAGLHVAYHGGRLLTYAALGAIAGALGAALDLGGSLAGVQRLAAAVAGALMVAFGLVAILRVGGAKLPRAPIPPHLQRLLLRGHRAAFDLPALPRAFAIGLLTTLLPCGWLYAFAITAAGTGSPALGALTMAVFWAGTLPVLIGLGVGIQSLTGPLRRRLPLLTSLALVGVGLYTIFGRLSLPAMAHPAPASNTESSAVERVRALDAEEMPCCHGG